MKILIEEHKYDQEVVRSVLPDSRLLLTGDKVKIENVGYYHNARAREGQNEDFVFFLPKVVMDKDGLVFKTDTCPGFTPEEIIDPDHVQTADGRTLDDFHRTFLYEFSVWIYRALAHYLERNSDAEAVWYCHDRQSGAFRRKYVTTTFLDVILALIRFNRENQDYFLFKVKERHSGLNKINWTRTISRTQAIVQDGVPVYLNPRNKKRMVDFDEELLVIFYSILEYIHNLYGFPVKIGMGFELITGDKFKRYLNGYGVTRLRQIKYKYFSDRDLALWELCFAFFDKAHQANVSAGGEDYLLAKEFEKVFEAMIDELLGDEELAKLKKLDDGKQLDHLYVDDSLTRKDGWKTFCIADSKYYKVGNALEWKSVAKQFTYAKDMLQLNLDLFLPQGDEVSTSTKKAREVFDDAKVRLLRDPETEGYDIIPNFFISAHVESELSYEKSALNLRPPEDGREYLNIHYENRLFDRDTLILAHFDVNFLYVLKLYAQNDEGERQRWRRDARDLFRGKIRDLLQGHFSFYALMPHNGVDAQAFFRENFKYTAGKIYSPYPDVDGNPVYSLALQNPDNPFDDENLSPDGKDARKERIKKENTVVKEMVDSAFYRVKCEQLSDDPSDKLREVAARAPVSHATTTDAAGGVQVVSKVSGPFTYAVTKCGMCPCPADQCDSPETIQTLVIPFTQGAHLFRVVAGGHPSLMTFEQLNESTNNVFKGVKFPSMPLWVWSVEQIG